MNFKTINRKILISAIGLLLCLGTGNVVNAQNDKKPDKKPPLAQPKRTEPNPERQKVYVQQQTQNKQRYDQRSQVYQQGQQKWTVQKQQIQQTVVAKPDQRAKPLLRDPNIQKTQVQLRVLNEQNQRNQAVAKQKRVNTNDLVRISERQKQWHQSEQTWQNAYNSRWTNQQNLFTQRENQLRQQNRRQHLAFQQAYWERVREDQMRLQSWTFYDDVGLQYGYTRGGQYYYTSQYGMNMVRDAINDGYQEGFLAGQSDREDGWRSNYRDPLAYQDASYGYNGYWIGLDEYQYYFREGFRRGYEDGYNSRYRYGRYDNGGFSILDAILTGIVTFAAIVD